MDIAGKVENQSGWVGYASEVVDDSRYTVERFNERVRTWAQTEGIELGEGHFETRPRGPMPGKVLYIQAPVSMGDWNRVNNSVIFPKDETCVNLPN